MNIQKLRISKIWMASALLILGTAPGIASAQVLSEIEGPIDSIVVKGLTTTITVMGIDVTVNNGLFGAGMVHTPTAKLLYPHDLDEGQLPGRFDELGNPILGFKGGTAIIMGVSTPGTPVMNNSGGIELGLGEGFVATDVFVEPAENVVLGSVTAVAPGTNGALCDVYVEGTHAVFLTDYRMPANPPINGFGFEVDPCLVALGGAAAIEGYYGADGKLYIFDFESDDAPAVLSNIGVTNISRADCDKGKIEIRGSSTLAGIAGGSTAVISDAVTGFELGRSTLIADPITGNSIYRYRDDVGTCPEVVKVETWDDAGGITTAAEAPVDVRR